MSFRINNTLYIKYLYFLALSLNLCVFPLPATSQNSDSLMKSISSIKDQRLQLSEYKKLANLNLTHPDPNSVVLARKYTDLAQKYGSDLDLADAYHFEGLTNKANENLIRAIESFLSEQTLREKLADSTGLAENLYYLGDCYRAVFDPVPADGYLDKAYSLYEKLKDTAGLAKTLNRKAAVNIDSQDPQKLEVGFLQARTSNAFARKIGNYDLQVSNNVLIGSFYGQTNKQEKALEILSEAKELLPKAQEKSHMALVLSNIATIYNKMGKYDEAVIYGKLACQDALMSGLRVYQWAANWSVYEAYKGLNEEDSLYKYLSKSLMARVSIIDEVRDKQKTVLMHKFLNEKFNYELQSHKKQSRLVLIILLISICSAITFIALILIRNKRLRRINILLAEQNQVIENQKLELTQLTRQKDKFYSIIAHDLRSPFNSILGFSEILTEELGEIHNPRLYKMAENLNQSAIKVFQLLENLLQWCQLQENILNTEPANISLSTLIKNILPAMQDIAARKEIKINSDLGDSLYVYADKRMLSSVLTNLLWNALKFTPKKGSIQISATRISDNMTAIQVKDSGIGMCAKMVGNLFEFHASNNRPGIEGEPSSGLGLMICKEFTEQNGGRISVESEEGKGSIFTVTVPSN